MSKKAFIKFDDQDIQDGLFRSIGFTELFAFLPSDSKITSFIPMNGHTIFHIESSLFITTKGTGLLPEIKATIIRGPGSPSIDFLDMSAALAAYQPQGAPVSCTRTGCTFNSPCMMCTANASATSLPIYATPSPWGQVVSVKGSGSITYVGTPPVPGDIVTMDIGDIIPRKGTSNLCSHKWKSYQGLSEKFDYCETCNVKRA